MTEKLTLPNEDRLIFDINYRAPSTLSTVCMADGGPIVIAGPEDQLGVDGKPMKILIDDTKHAMALSHWLADAALVMAKRATDGTGA